LHIEPEEVDLMVEEPYEEEDIDITLIIVIVSVLLILNIFVVYMCRRQQKRNMQDELSKQIKSAVDQYVTLSSKEEASSASTRT